MHMQGKIQRCALKARVICQQTPRDIKFIQLHSHKVTQPDALIIVVQPLIAANALDNIDANIGDAQKVSI